MLGRPPEQPQGEGSGLCPGWWAYTYCTANIPVGGRDLNRARHPGKLHRLPRAVGGDSAATDALVDKLWRA